MTENNFCEIAEAVCKHPEMYTPTGSFYEVISFLEGYGNGANVGENTFHSTFTPFHKWLLAKQVVNQSIHVWGDFRKHYSSDSEALDNFVNLYREYVQQL
jgi:hypothetical protein